MRTSSPPISDADVDGAPRAGVCVALLGSALIHGTVVGDHLGEWLPAGLFFLAVVAVETALALATVYAWGRRTAQAIVLAGLGTVAVWALSRTVGMPVGPANFRVPEATGVSDMACCFLEIGAALLVFRTAFPGWTIGARLPRAGRWGAALATVVAVTITAWGLQPTLAGHDSNDGHGHHTSS